MQPAQDVTQDQFALLVDQVRVLMAAVGAIQQLGRCSRHPLKSLLSPLNEIQIEEGKLGRVGPKALIVGDACLLLDLGEIRPWDGHQFSR